MDDNNVTTNATVPREPGAPRPGRPNLPRTPAEVKAQRKAANARREQLRRNERALRGVVAQATHTNYVSDPARPVKARG